MIDVAVDDFGRRERKFVADFGVIFFFKKVSAKARAKAQKPIWGGRLGPLGPGPPENEKRRKKISLRTFDTN